MQTRGHNTLVIEQHDEALRHYIEQLSDDQDNSAAQPYLEQYIYLIMLNLAHFIIPY